MPFPISHNFPQTKKHQPFGWCFSYRKYFTYYALAAKSAIAAFICGIYVLTN